MAWPSTSDSRSIDRPPLPGLGVLHLTLTHGLRRGLATIAATAACFRLGVLHLTLTHGLRRGLATIAPAAAWRKPIK